MLATVLQPTSLRSGVGDHNPNEKKNLQKRLDVEVVGSEDNLEEHLLINGDEFLIPLADVGGALASLVLVGLGVGCRKRLAAVVLAVLQYLCLTGVRDRSLITRRQSLAFFKTLEETLGRGMGWSDSPTSKEKKDLRGLWRTGLETRHTLKHVLDEDAALNDLLVGVELFVIGSDEKDHFVVMR
jgi:hypothetical protein